MGRETHEPPQSGAPPAALRPAPTLPVAEIAESLPVGPYVLERVDLRFSNGQQRRYDRLVSCQGSSVMIAALPDNDTVLLVREYAVGTGRYELGLPKGRVDPGESAIEAAGRELREEVGMAARQLVFLRALTQSPAYMTHSIDLFLARDLYPAPLVGDEPEVIEVVPWRLDRLHELMLRDDCSEARTLAGLFLVREWLSLDEDRK